MKAEEIFKNNPNFEPSLKVKQLWLKTRKVKKTYGEKRFQGFFITDEEQYMWDGLMSTFVILLEILGVVAIILSSSTYWIVKVIGVILFSAGDFLLAALSKKNDDQINLHHNKITIAEFEKFLAKNDIDRNRAEDKISDFNKVINEFRNKSLWFLFGLFGFCCIKIVLFFFEIKGGFGGWFLSEKPIFYFTPLLYFIVMLIQWFFVGYFWNTNTFHSEIESEVRKHQAQLKHFYRDVEDKPNKEELLKRKIESIIYKAKNRHSTIELNTDIQTTLQITDLKNANVNSKHFLSEKKTTLLSTRVLSNTSTETIIEGKLEYELNTIGILTDDDLHKIASEQDTSNQKLLTGIEGLKHQIKIFEQE